jgi:threonine dehydrogenase-like Zn-dependent dehydrogenase
VPEPVAPATGELLCRSVELGICGTDREILASRTPRVPDGAEFLVLGHECLARVEAVGEGIDDFAAGDWVVPVVRRPKPIVASIANPPRVDMLAWGDYTERGIVHEHGFSAAWWLDRPEFLFPVAEAIRPIAVLAEPIAVAEKGINEAIALQRARLGEHTWRDASPRVLVTGMGPIGFAALVACRCRDWDVTIYGRDDPDSSRAELARSFGGRYLSALKTPWAELAAPGVPETDGFDLVLECTGSDVVMTWAATGIAARGVMVWLGSSRRSEPVVHDMATMMRNGLLRNQVFVGCVNAAPRDFRAALDDLAQLDGSHPESIRRMITDRVSRHDAPWHYVNRKPDGIKVVVDFE